MRNNDWLAQRMYDLWDDYFADVPRINFVAIKFGRNTKRQLGSIKWADKHTRIQFLLRKKDIKETVKAQDDGRITVITISRQFQDESVPEYVVNATIAHELCHYAHGFHSPLKQRYKHPHQGGLIEKELTSRGLGETHQKATQWIQRHWREHIS